MQTNQKQYTTQQIKTYTLQPQKLKQEMTKYSIAVFIFIILFGLYFYGLDAFFAWITSLVKGL